MQLSLLIIITFTAALLPLIILIDADFICDFENNDKCGWQFTSPDLADPHDPGHNFKIIVGNREGKACKYILFINTNLNMVLISSIFYLIKKNCASL